jgi:hypothetical protein
LLQSSHMIYTVSSFEKIHPWLYKNGNQIIGQRLAFWESQAPIFIGGFLILFIGIHALAMYLSKELVFSSFGVEHVVYLLGAGIGGWFFKRGKAAWDERKERGGVLPGDTFITLDGATKTAIKQKNLEEQRLGTFENIHLSIEVIHSKNNKQYRLTVVHPGGKELLAIAKSKSEAEKLLQDVKSHLSIT